MGNTQGFQGSYSSPVKGTETADTTPTLRAPTHPDELIDDFQEIHMENAWDLFMRGYTMCQGTSPCIGYRRRSATDGELAAGYSWLTFADVKQSALTLGTALLEEPGCMADIEYPDEVYKPAQKLKPLGLFCKNRVEWLMCELAANAYNFALVPLYDTLGTEALEFILQKTRLATIGCSLECLPTLLDAIETTKYVRYVLLFLDPHEKVSVELKERMESLNLTSLYYNDIVEENRKSLAPAPGSLESVNTICYTSGTTGLPKGVLLTHRNVVGCSVGIMRGPISGDFPLAAGDIHLSYLPLAHVLERLVCNVVFALGASVGMYSGDQTKLLEDIRVLRPSVFVSVPRVYNRINDAVFRGASEKSQLQRFFFEKGMSRKLNRLRINASTNDKLWDPLVFNKTRKLMGERLKWMISGGAPLDAAVQENMKILFCAPLMEGYGLTETFGPAFLANPRDPVAGHVGGVVPCNEFKLQSVPEMNYLVTDKPPRGELLIRGAAITPGYFLDAAETAAAFDSEGWFHTGDIALILPSGGLKIIDRKKNIFKLAQGEYIAPEKIEAVYSRASLVSQIFVFGYSDASCLIAIVVPDPEASSNFAKKHPELKSLHKGFAELCGSPIFKAEVMKDMDAAATESGLKGFEKVRAIEFHLDPFSIENGLLTPSLKIKRHQAKVAFQAEIDKMYATLK